MNELAYSDVSRLIQYDPDSGEMRWLPRPQNLFANTASFKSWNTRYAGTTALNYPNRGGYLRGDIFSRTYSAHRVAWLLFYRTWPVGCIDHIDGDRTNNKIANLRDVTESENSRNAAKKSNNKSGHTGVSWHDRSQRWQAHVMVSGKAKHLGYYPQIEQAIAARELANRMYGFSHRHGN